MELADALIGATAVVNGLSILAWNDNHYRVIKELNLEFSGLEEEFTFCQVKCENDFITKKLTFKL